jgi:DNA-binding transcriptional LysR family regulator
MEMHQIRYFLTLWKERHFTRAARRSGVSQPSLTNAIRALERELGGALFHRRPRVAPTALGMAVAPCLVRIAESVEQARAAARALADDGRPTSRESRCAPRSRPRPPAGERRSRKRGEASRGTRPMPSYASAAPPR